MEQVELAALTRKESGKGASHRLRADGRVPAILYGHGEDNLEVSVSRREMYHLLHGEAASNTVVRLNVAEEEDGKSEEQISIIRDIQFDPVNERIIHVDFQRISLDETIHAEVPVHLVGECVGVATGGILDHILRFVEVECLPLEVPNSIDVDVSALEVGDNLHVGDLTIPEGITLLTSEDQAVAACAAPRVEEVKEPTEEELLAAEEAAEGEEGAAEGEEGKTEEGAEEDKKSDKKE